MRLFCAALLFLAAACSDGNICDTRTDDVGDYEEVMNKASCLSLLCNAVLAWNTVHIARIVDQLRAAGNEVKDEDLARVSPLAHAHVIPNGSYFQSPRRRAEAARIVIACPGASMTRSAVACNRTVPGASST